MIAPLTAEQAERALALRARRWGPDKIGRSIHASGAAVRAHFGMKPWQPRLLTHEDEIEIRRLYLQGAKRFALSLKFGIEHGAIGRICRGLQSPQDVRRERASRKVAFIEYTPPEVPAWVPPHLEGLYLNVAERHGEEEAASTCRKLKNGRSVVQSRLPAVVSPAGC